MDTISVSAGYVLCRVEDDGSVTIVSDHENFSDGVAAGKHMVEVEDRDYSYSLHTSDLSGRLCRFAYGRIGYREWAMRTGRLNPAVEDKYLRDEDEWVR